jgi:predicted nucleic acid-binding protein
MNLVLDASVASTWLLHDGNAADATAAVALLEELRNPAAGVLVPATWTLEMANVLARGESRGILTENQTQAFRALLAALPISVDGQTAARSLTTTLELARRYSLSAYDASYLELALRVQLPLATFDRDLRRAAAQAGVADALSG